MSSAEISMHLDEKTQIIYQHVEGIIDDEDSDRLYSMTDVLAARLKDRHKVRILTISDRIGKTSSNARKALLRNMRDPDLYKIAVMGRNPYMKALFTFILSVSGMKKTKMFTDEADAVRWLCE
jgi:hypothetical protein